MRFEFKKGEIIQGDYRDKFIVLKKWRYETLFSRRISLIKYLIIKTQEKRLIMRGYIKKVDD